MSCRNRHRPGCRLFRWNGYVAATSCQEEAQEIVEKGGKYDDALEGYKTSMEGAVTTGIVAGSAGGATTLGLLKQIRHNYKMCKTFNQNERAVAKFLAKPLFFGS